jgi:2-polyprenyl-3-methyl-5-hydroxy-6-metoxy-1,4-benzoquinol methylase
MTVDPSRLARLHYEDFKALASEDGLSPHERIGFPDAYREGMEDAILADLRSKASNLDVPSSAVVDIGCGCGVLAQRLIDYCSEMRHCLVVVDSAEVLAQLPDLPNVRKAAGRFPKETGPALADLCGQADVVIAYSVLHYIVLDANPFDFLDRALALLAPGGELLVGDVPNLSMRRRFFYGAAGQAFHRSFTGTDTDPEVVFNTLVPDRIDDSVVIGLVMRARSAGFDAFVVPQRRDLPMANRREDLLFRRP